MVQAQKTVTVGANGDANAQQARKNRFYTAAALLNGRIAPGSVFITDNGCGYSLTKKKAIKIIANSANAVLEGEPPIARKNILDALGTIRDSQFTSNGKIGAILGDRTLVEQIRKNAEESRHVVEVH